MDPEYSYANVAMDEEKPPQEEVISENMQKFDGTIFDTTIS